MSERSGLRRDKAFKLKISLKLFLCYLLIFSNQVEQWLNDKFMAGLIGPNTLVAEMLNVRFQKNM